MADDFGSGIGAGNIGNVAVGGAITGNIEVGGDIDWFRVTLAAGQSYIITMNATSALDPRFTLLDANGIAVTGNDDYLGSPNARINFTAPVGGTYYIAGGSPFADGVDSVGTYVVGVTINPSPPPPPTDDFGSQVGDPAVGSITVPGTRTGTINYLGDHDWFAVSLTAGQAYFFRQDSTTIDSHLFLRDSIGNVLTSNDDGGGAPNSLISFTATVTGTYFLEARSFQDSETGTYTVSTAFNGAPPPPPVDDYGSQVGGNLGSVTVNGAASTGNLEAGLDHDWFAVTLSAGSTYRFNVNRTTLDDPRFTLLNSAGTTVGVGNDDAAPGNLNAQADYTPTISGTYYIDVNSSDGTDTGTYTVSATQLNTAPTLGANAGLTLNEGASGTITAARLDFNDAEQADSAITYTVNSAATNGTLFRGGIALSVNSTFTQADINSNLITYTHNGRRDDQRELRLLGQRRHQHG